MHTVCRFFSRLYFRVLFGIVRWHGFVPVARGGVAGAFAASLEMETDCEKSGFLRDNNGNSHKCGKKIERKVRAASARMYENLMEGVAAGLSRQGYSRDW